MRIFKRLSKELVTPLDGPVPLRIPSRLSRQASSFDTRGRKVDAWLASLPLANIGETAQQVLHRLDELNRIECPADERFQALELFRPTVRHLTDALKVRFLETGFPLPDKHRRLAQLARKFQDEMATGYKIIFITGLTERPAGLDDTTFIASLHRALLYLSGVLLTSYEIYAPRPPNVWQEAHWLYLFAERHGFHEAAVRDNDTPGFPESTAGAVYRRLLLLALACPYGLSRNEVEKVYEAAGRWQSRLQVLRPVDPHSSNALFAVDLFSDDQPAHFVLNKNQQPLDPDHVRLLDTSPIEDLLSAQLRSNESSGAARDGDLGEDTLRRLTMAWGVTTRRRFSRAAVDTSVEVVIGLSAVRYVCAANESTRADSPSGAPSGIDDAAPPAPEIDAFDRPATFLVTDVPAGERLDDVWDVVRPNARTDRSTWITTSDTPAAPAPVLCTMVDQSATGCRLRWQAPQQARVEVGQLIAMRDRNGAQPASWAIGVIRWMKNPKETHLELGIQVLAPSATRVSVRRVDARGNGAGLQKGLLLPRLEALNQAITLILPAILNNPNDVVVLADAQQHTRLRLTRRLESSVAFARFEVATVTVPQPDDDDDDGLELDQVWQYL